MKNSLRIIPYVTKQFVKLKFWL